MKHFVKEYVRGFIDEECENLAREGLRTLVITQKELTKAEYEEWALKYDQANQTIDNREAETQKVIN